MTEAVLKSLPSTSGTLIKHTGSYSNWCVPSELSRVMKALHHSATGPQQDWLGTRGKYVDLRIDMRTGTFIIKDEIGNRIDDDDETMTKFGLAKQRSGALDNKIGPKTKYKVYEEAPGQRTISPCSKADRELNLTAGLHWGTTVLIGYADSLTHAQPHLTSAVTRVENSS